MKPKKFILLLVILFIAFSIRSYRLTEFPPGLTHDEANHGREAIGILDGIFLYYFPLNYGSEPLYSYIVAGSMLLIGENLFSLRFVNIIFSIGAMGLAYLWTTRTFDRSTALLALALTAVSFWSLATSREALRAGMLPFFMTASVWFFWLFIKPIRDPVLIKKVEYEQQNNRKFFNAFQKVNWQLIGFAISVSATLHIYLAARVAWIIFPLFLIYLVFSHCDLASRVWRPTILGLIIAGLIVTPMFIYVNNHPEVLTRLDMLDRPLEEVRQGNFMPVLQNAVKALLAFVWPGFGDQFLAYNIPGRPVFNSLSAVFFVAGILFSIWRWKQPQYAFLLLWFVVGISPSLVTGPTANTTRNLAALPPVYLLPVIGFFALTQGLTSRFSWFKQQVITGAACIWLIFTGWTTVTDYFVHWGQSPEVRGAYQHTLVESIHHLKQLSGGSIVIFSTVYPGPVHDPSISLILLSQPGFETRWVDARNGFLFPDDPNARAIIPASTPLHSEWADLLDPLESVTLRPDDLDPGFTVYKLDLNQLAQLPKEDVVNFNNGVTLTHSHWLQPMVGPGETAELLTIWEVTDAKKTGPLVPPINTTDLALFTQVLDKTGKVFTQKDSLDAPSWDWQTGDTILQIHQVVVPETTESGSYDTIVGIYDRYSKQRLPVFDDKGIIIDDRAFVDSLQVKNP